MKDHYLQVKDQVLPVVPLRFAELPGRSGTMVVQ
jgi:undecaprenyl phosphate-alpha-L-ara4FN deformylase